MTTNADDLVQRVRDYDTTDMTLRGDIVAGIERRDAEIERLRAEVATMRDRCIAAYKDSLAVIERAKEWQQYAEAIEKDANATMADEIQRLRREKPKVERELAELRERFDRGIVVEVRECDYVSIGGAKLERTIIGLVGPYAQLVGGKRVRLVVEP